MEEPFFAIRYLLLAVVVLFAAFERPKGLFGTGSIGIQRMGNGTFDICQPAGYNRVGAMHEKQ